MPSDPVQITQVWKSYGRIPAVRDLTLSVPAGSVYGFLGPNGAGKSTTIRMMLGLQRPDRGTMALFGQPLQTTLLRKIGSLVESPSLYQHLTGRENLEVHRRLLNLPKTAVDRALETVDLTVAAGRLVRQYSSGMKQRLGIAVALLGNPQLLVLDEPTNGLDPAGIHEVRQLIQTLPSTGGVTVFLSSHLLVEVEQAATHLAIISAGTLRFQGTAAELRRKSRQNIVLHVDQPERAASLLRDLGCSVEAQAGRLTITRDGACEPAWINAILVQAGIGVSHLAQEHLTLEDLFLELTAPSETEKETSVR